MENSETLVWIDFAVECSYINQNTSEYIKSKINDIGKMLNHMIKHPEKYDE